MNRISRRLAQDELAAVEQNSRLAMIHHNQGVHQAVQDAVNQVVFESSAREPKQRIDLGHGGMRNSFLNRKRSSISTKAPKSPSADGAPSTR